MKIRDMSRIRGVSRYILLVRGQKVLLDSDLAVLYGVTTFNLNKAVRRNRDRFPPDFVFNLTRSEYHSLIFQIGISNAGRGGRRHLPFVFTEQGVAMLSSVLRSKRAAVVNISIMRAFIRLRRTLAANKALARKLSKLERRVTAHDGDISSLFDAIRQIIAEPKESKRQIGFSPPGFCAGRGISQAKCRDPGEK